jgi:hypothetical protein
MLVPNPILLPYRVMSRCYRILSCYHTESCHVVTESYPVTIQSQVMLPNPMLLPYRVRSCCYRILSSYHIESWHVVTESYRITIHIHVMLPNPILLPYTVKSCCYRILSYYHTESSHVVTEFYPVTIHSHVMLLPTPTLSPYIYISVVTISNPELTKTLPIHVFPSDYFHTQHWQSGLSYSFISIQPLGRFSRNQNPVMRPVCLWRTASWANS